MISIFAKRAFLNTSPNTEFESKELSYHGRGHLQRVSSIIRADQIVERLGNEARLNPTSGYEDDICIYVKPHLKKGMDMVLSGKRSYIDIIDGHNLGELAKKHPETGVIVCSEADKELMENELSNKVVFIPQHHCNFERFKRNSKVIKRIGMIGEENAFSYLPKGIKEYLETLGLELVTFSKFFERKDIIDFYMNIDLQLVWRPYKKILSNPLKIVNAMSFGVPTIALYEKAFKEVTGGYLACENEKQLIEHTQALLEYSSLYQTISDVGIKMSEKYHIDNVSKLYLEL